MAELPGAGKGSSFQMDTAPHSGEWLGEPSRGCGFQTLPAVLRKIFLCSA
jgi:hypothetical protein